MKSVNLEKTLRDAARKSGLSVYALAKRAGLPVTTVQQFMGGRGMQLRTASRLCDVLALNLVPSKRKAGAG